MKKCTYCGRDYPDDAVRCALDGELLAGEGEPLVLVAPPLPRAALPAATESRRAFELSARQLQAIELVLICLIAFGNSLWVSGYYFFGHPLSSSGSRTGWTSSIIHETGALALLWYILLRRGKSFTDLGLVWKWKDVAWSILLILGSYAAYHITYRVIRNSGFVSTGSTTISTVGNYLFHGGPSGAALTFQFLNPFYEELIVRAYLMSQIRQLTGNWVIAVLFSTALQTGYHFYQGAPLALSCGMEFLLFSLFYAKTNRITPIVLAHLYFDVHSTVTYWTQHG